MVYQLKITLREIEPPIWRRVLVLSDITFYKLHKTIQAAFGWQDYHLKDRYPAWRTQKLCLYLRLWGQLAA